MRVARHQGINHYSTTVLWGAIGEIGLRKADDDMTT